MQGFRTQVLDRMIGSAESLGANAVVGVRLAICPVDRDVLEILAYGTAVVVV